MSGGPRQFLRRLRPSAWDRPLAASALTLAGGTAAGQAAGFLVAPILTRLYDDVDFGAYGLFTTFLMFAGAVITAQFESAIVSAESDRDAVNLSLLSLGLQVPLSMIATLCFVVLWGLDIVDFGVFPWWAAGLAFVALVGLGSHQVARYWLLRQSRYGVISYLNPLQSVTRAGTQIGFGVGGGGLVGLVAGETIARVIGGFAGIRRAFRGSEFRPIRPSLRDLKDVAVRYVDFPKYMIGSTLLDRGGFLVPLPFIAGLYGLGPAGLYALAQRAFGVPTALIGQSLADAFHTRIAAYQEQRDVAGAQHLATRLTIYLAVTGGVISVTVLATGPAVFAAVFGPQWRMAGSIAGAMSIAFAASLVIVPLSRIMVVFGGQREKLRYDVLSLVLTLLSCYLAVRGSLQLTAFIWVLSTVNVAAYAYYYVLLRRVMNAWFEE